MLAGKSFDGRRDRAKGVDDFGGDRRKPCGWRHRAHCRVGGMDRQAPDIAEKILMSARTIAVVGLSPDPRRPSHGVARYLQRAGYRIIPVNPNLDEVLGEPAYASLRQVPEPIDG